MPDLDVARVGAFTTQNGHGVCLFAKGNGAFEVSLTIEQAQSAAVELIRTLGVARRRRDTGEWPDGPGCRHGDGLQGRIEHALFYAMRDEYEDECIDEYAASFAESILRELALTDSTEQGAKPDPQQRDIGPESS